MDTRDIETIDVYKSILGWANATAEHFATHCIMKLGTYEALCDNYNSAKSDADSYKKKYKSLDKKYNELVDKYNALLKTVNESRTNDSAVNKRIAELENQVNTQAEFNENLKRICRENANAKRKLTPKKKHSGFVLKQSSETLYAPQGSRTRYPVFRTTIETPYSVSMELSFCKSNAWEDGLVNYFDSTWVEPAPSLELKAITGDDTKKMNFAFKFIWRANYKSGLWEVDCFHLQQVCIDVEKHDKNDNVS